MNFKADRLQGLVENDGRDQKVLALAIGVSAGALSHWLTGKRKPKSEELFKVARFFKVPSDYFASDWTGSVKVFEPPLATLREDVPAYRTGSALDAALEDVRQMRERLTDLERKLQNLKRPK